MKIHIKGGRLVDPKNGVDGVQDLYITAGRSLYRIKTNKEGYQLPSR